MRSALIGLALTVSLLPGAVRASDGVLEINQACAVNTGCFPGDTAGYPVTVIFPGSYRLTGNLVVLDPAITAIQLEIPDVSLDLAGFQIIGANCVGATTPCNPSPAGGFGVLALTGAQGASIRNGSVIGMGGAGVAAGARAEITGMHVRWNAGGGINAGSGAVISGNTADQNGGIGIFAASGSITGNTASSNTWGIESSMGAVISGNAVTGNADGGIFALGGVISGNTVELNNSDGIRSASRTLIIGNEVGLNLGPGIVTTGSRCRIEGNNVSNNMRGIQVSGTENIILRNTASSNSSGNYSIAAGNSYGPLVPVPGVGDISATAGADHPWANFGY